MMFITKSAHTHTHSQYVTILATSITKSTDIYNYYLSTVLFRPEKLKTIRLSADIFY